MVKTAARKVLLLGGTRPHDLLDPERAERFSADLGRELALTTVTVLFNGNADNLASIAVRAMVEELADEAAAKARIMTFVPRSHIRHDPYDSRPLFSAGTQVVGGEYAEDRRDLMMREADVVVAYCGRRGTRHSLDLAEKYQVRAIVIPQFGGSSAHYFEANADRLCSGWPPGVDSLLLALRDHSLDPRELARNTVTLVRAASCGAPGSAPPSWGHELGEAEALIQSFAPTLAASREFQAIDLELRRLRGSCDHVVVLTTVRRAVEIVVIRLCETGLRRDRGTEPLRRVIEKLRNEAVVPEEVASHLLAANDIGKFGPHPIPVEQTGLMVKAGLANLIGVLRWFLAAEVERAGGAAPYRWTVNPPY